MSLIVVRKDNDKLGIVSDTKLTYPDHEVKKNKANPSEGLVKTVVLNSELAVSFAGEVEFAEAALKEIVDNSNVPGILEVLQKYHTKSNEKTDFLICTGKPSFNIYKIKDGKLINEKEFSWIGDQDAFNDFQKFMIASPNKKTDSQPQSDNPIVNPQQTGRPGITITQMNISIEPSRSSNIISKMSSAMDSVIENSLIESVGGFKVSVVYENKFLYNFYSKVYRSNVRMEGNGTHTLGHGDASEGGYSINFFGSSQDYQSIGLHILQGNFGIVYHRTDNGLLRPQVINLDEIDFSDFVKEKFGISIGLITQDRIRKFMNDANVHFNNREFTKAENSFDKALNEAKGIEKAKVLFNKGIILLRLIVKRPAMKAFQDAVKIDPSYSQKIMQVLNSRKG